MAYDAGTTSPSLAGLAEWGSIRINDVGTFVAVGFTGLFGGTEVDAARSRRPAHHGARRGPGYYTGREFDLGGVVRGADLDDLQDMIDLLCAEFALPTDPDEFGTLRIRRRSWSDYRRLTVQVDGAVVIEEPAPEERTQRWRSFTVPMFAPDPRHYADTARTTLTLTPGAAAAAAGNDGSVLAPFVVRFTGPFTGPIELIDDNQAGAKIELTGDVAAGDWIEVDTDAETVTTNTGASYQQRLVADDLRGIAPGGSALRFTVTGGSTGATIAEVDYRDTWAG